MKKLGYLFILIILPNLLSNCSANIVLPEGKFCIEFKDTNLPSCNSENFDMCWINSQRGQEKAGTCFNNKCISSCNEISMCGTLKCFDRIAVWKGGVLTPYIVCPVHHSPNKKTGVCEKKCIPWQYGDQCPVGQRCDMETFTCEPGSNNHTWACAKDKQNCPTGMTCELNTCVVLDNPCQNVTCDNNGKCIDYTGKPFCACNEGYENSYKPGKGSLSCEKSP